MYEPYFGLRARPFAAVANRHQYFAAGAIQHARQTLGRCIARAEGPALLIGPAGTGKTLLCQVLADDFAGQLDTVLVASGNLGTSRSLLQVIMFELELPYRGLDEGELRLALIERLTRQRNARGLLLLVDEAQVLPTRLLEELRLTTNIELNGQPQVHLVLSGSAELEERLTCPKFESLNQRIAARCYLEAFNLAETRGYISARISASGSDAARIFSADALDQIYQATEGIPRLVNQLCDHALLLAFAAEMRTVDSRVINEAWADLQQLPSPWNQSEQFSSAGSESTETEVIEFGTLDDEPATLPLSGFVELPAVSALSSEPTNAGKAEPILACPEPACAGDADFLDEEVVIDPYAALDARTDLIRHRVSSSEGRAIWKQLAPFADAALRSSVRVVAETTGTHAGASPTIKSKKADKPVETHKHSPPLGAPEAAKPEPTAVPSRPPAAQDVQAENTPTTNDDLIIVEEDATTLERAKAPGFERVRRQEYRQLFKKLRSG